MGKGVYAGKQLVDFKGRPLWDMPAPAKYVTHEADTPQAHTVPVYRGMASPIYNKKFAEVKRLERKMRKTSAEHEDECGAEDQCGVEAEDGCGAPSSKGDGGSSFKEKLVKGVEKLAEKVIG